MQLVPQRALKRWRPQCTAHVTPQSTPWRPSDRAAVWVRGISWQLTRAKVLSELQQGLQQAGGADVRSIHVLPAGDGPRRTARKDADHKGWAVVSYVTAEAANAAIPRLLDVLAGLAATGRTIQVCHAPPELLASIAEGVPGHRPRAGSDSSEGRRLHRQRQRSSKREAHVGELESILSRVAGSPGPMDYSALPGGPAPGSTAPAAVIIDWDTLPPACQVTVRSLGRGDSSGSETGSDHTVPLRVRRKRAQAESFAAVLQALLPGSIGPGNARTPRRVVDFGCGSGNLLLPLAASFPGMCFHGVDAKRVSVDLLLRRAQAAGLSNVTASVQRIEDFQGPLDVALALHACGAATDLALLQAQAARAAFVVSPCCIGKAVAAGPLVDVPLSTQRGAAPVVSYPRSRWLASQLPTPAPDAFRRLARTADVSHSRDHTHVGVAVRAKTLVEADRVQAMREQGYTSRLTRLLQPELHEFKADLLVGVPDEGVAAGRFNAI